MYTRLCRYYLHVPYLTYLLVRAIRSIDRSNSKYIMIGEKRKERKGKKEGRDLQRERESLDISLHKVFSLQEITYISLEYLDGKTNKRESRRGNSSNTLHNNLTTGLLATHFAFPPPLKIDGRTRERHAHSFAPSFFIFARS